MSVGNRKYLLNQQTLSNTQVTTLILYLINGGYKFMNVQMCIDTFGQCHGSGMTNNFFNNCLIYMSVCKHGDCCVTAAVWCAVDVQTMQ